MKKIGVKKLLALILIFALTLSGFGNVSQAASKRYVKSLKLSKSTVSIKKGKKVKIKATVKVYGKAKKTIRVKSSNNSVAKVKVGKTNKKGVTELTITARKAGNAKITVTTKDKAKNKKVIKKTIRVKVTSTKKPTSNSTEKPATTENQATTEKPATTESTATTEKPATTESTATTEKPASAQVKWTVSEENFMGAYSQKDEETGKSVILSKKLTRKYVSFSPWPTTDEQVKYVIKNCNDPYVIGALYVVALDNFEYKGLGNYTGEVYKMLNTLMSGAGTVTGSNYQLSNFAKQKICEFGSKQVRLGDGTVVKVSSFASRAYLKGATPYNNYTPEGGMKDKTKWKIVMDEYVYCGDLGNGYITVCPQRYSEEQLTEESEQTVVEHWQGIRIGFRWNNTAKVWLPTDNTALSKPPTGSLVPFNVESQILFSSNYMAPVPNQGF